MAELKVSKEAKFAVALPEFDSEEAINQFEENKSQALKIQNSVKNELTNTEEKYSIFRLSNDRILDSLGEAILVIDPNNYKILNANKAASKQLKLRKEDLVGKKCYEVTHHKLAPCESPNDVCPIKELLLTGKSTTVEHQHFDKENRRIDVEISVHPVKDNNGKIIQIIHIDRDITSRKELERKEKTKSDEIRAIIDGIGDLLFVMDNNRVLTEVNKTTCETFKKKPEELVGKHCYEIVHGTDCPWPSCPATKTFETKQAVTEEVNDSNLGTPLLVTTSPILDERGEIQKVIHIAKDISKIKLAEMELHLAANLFDAASDSIIVHEMDGRLVYFNEAAYKTRGYTSDEFQALSIKDLEASDSPRFFGARMIQLLNNGEATFEAVNLRKDRTVLPVEINARVIESDGRKLILSVARDITERKKAEEALKESEKEYRSLFSNMMDGLAYCQMIFDEKSKPVDFIYLQINDAFERITGLKRDAVIGKRVTIAIPGIKDANPELFEIYGRVALTGQTAEFEVFLKPLKMWLQISVYCPRKGYFAAIFEDTTERKEAEEKLRENGRKIELMIEKLRVVGSLTRHDVRNKLSTVTGFAYLLKKKHPDQLDIVEGLNKMEQAVKETVGIFDFAKMYEQLGAEELTYVNVESKLNEATSLFSGSLPKIMCECHGLNVLADSFLRQLFYNFIDNTRKYGQKTSIIRVSCEKTESDNLRLVYEDDGVGISFENKNHLFKEGFSTGNSTGFGLFLTKKMMDVYGWTIEESGEPEKGARFTITIPKMNQHGQENYRIDASNAELANLNVKWGQT